jgi:hypothetical protein
MYVCICNAITEKMLQKNCSLISVIGSKCGKCLEGGRVFDNGCVTYLKNDEDRKNDV